MTRGKHQRIIGLQFVICHCERTLSDILAYITADTALNPLSSSNYFAILPMQFCGSNALKLMMSICLELKKLTVKKNNRMVYWKVVFDIFATLAKVLL